MQTTSGTVAAHARTCYLAANFGSGSIAASDRAVAIVRSRFARAGGDNPVGVDGGEDSGENKEDLGVLHFEGCLCFDVEERRRLSGAEVGKFGKFEYSLN